jgi:phosphoribosylpyrophosphate synthetase
VFVTDTVSLARQNWPQLRVISIAPLIAGAMQRFLGNGSLGEVN